MTTEMLASPQVDPAAGDRVAARARIVAVAASTAMAVLYLAVFAGIVSVGRADTGELGVLGVAGGLFAVLALALRRWRHRALWLGTAVLQVLLGAMYVAIAPERDPPYEVWGVTIRGLSVVLFLAVVTLLVSGRRRRSAAAR